MAAEELATVRISRFDPKVDEAPRYDEFRVPYRERSVLDLLNDILERCDPTLAFRFGCKIGACDGCLVVLNGRAVLACQTQAEREMTIAPLPKFKVVRDLVTDFGSSDAR